MQLVGDTEEEVERDFEAIHDNEELGMIDYSVICPAPPAIGAVVVVDPFSSGEWFLLIIFFDQHFLQEFLQFRIKLPYHSFCLSNVSSFRLSSSQAPTSPRWCCCGATS